MLLLDDDDALPDTPHPEEVELAERLGAVGLGAIDAALLACCGNVRHKLASIIFDAMKAAGFPHSDEYVDLHARRLIGLARSGQLEVFGDPRRPRWSEARLAVAQRN